MSKIKLLCDDETMTAQTGTTAIALLSTDVIDSLRRRGFNIYKDAHLLSGKAIIGRPVTIDGRAIARITWLEQYKDNSVYVGMTIIEPDTFQKNVIDGPYCYVGIAWSFTMTIGCSQSDWKYVIESVSFQRNSHFVGAGKVEWC